MAHPLAFCQTCGVVFEATAIALANVENITLRNNRVSCPQGHMARMFDGRFSVINGTLSVLEGTQFTREQVHKLNALKEQVRRRAISAPSEPVPPEFIQALKDISPGLGGAWSLLQDKKYGWAFLLLFLSVAITRCSDGGPLIDLSTKVETHYHFEETSNLQESGKQENSGGTKAASDSAEAEDRERDSAREVKFRHVPSFRSALLRSTAIWVSAAYV